MPVITNQKYLTPSPNKPWFISVCNLDSFENTAGNREIARNKQFLHFPQCFLMVWRTFRHFIMFKIVVCKHFEFGRV